MCGNRFHIQPRERREGEREGSGYRERGRRKKGREEEWSKSDGGKEEKKKTLIGGKSNSEVC